MPALVDSAATGLNRDTILNETFWLYYCCCYGEGLGKVADPLCGSESKTLCMHSTCVTADVMAEDGLCSHIEVDVTESAQCMLPPLDGAPKCVCFNIPLAPGGGPSGKDPAGLFEYDKIFSGTWWIVYMFCCGYGLNGLQAGGRPMYGSVQKCLICRTSVQIEPNEWPGDGQGLTSWKNGVCKDGGDVYEASFGKMLCCFNQFQCPPAPSAPLVAICNKKFGGNTADKFGN